MGKVIANHTAKVIKNSQPTHDNQQKLCNCLVKEECPMEGPCLKKEIIYQATVKSEGNETQHYIGLTANTFKKDILAILTISIMKIQMEQL